MLKNSLKKFGAVVCAFAVAAQMAVMPVARAEKLDGEAHLNEDILLTSQTITATTYSADAVTVAKEYSLGDKLSKATDFAVQFDVTLNTPQAPDSGRGNGARGRTAFYVEISGSDNNKTPGGVMHINTANDTSASFWWKHTSSQSLSGNPTMNVGEKYTVKMLVTSANTITLSIINKDGAVISETSGLGMRGATLANASKVIVGMNSQTNGTEASVTIENMVSYNPGPDEIAVSMDGKDLKTAGQTVELPKDKSYTGKFDIATKFKGAAKEAEVGVNLAMADGSALPAELKCDINGLYSDIMLEGNPEGEAPKEYDVILTVYLKAAPTQKLQFPIKLTKVQLPAGKLIEAYTPAVTDKEDADVSATITDDVILDKGNARVNVSWLSSDEAVINSDTGVVMPAGDDTDVTLTALVSSAELKTYFQEELDEMSEDEKAAALKEIEDGEAVLGKIVEYTYTVKGVKTIVDAAMASIKIVSNDDNTKVMDFTQSVNEDFVLPTTYSGNSDVTIEWSTNSSNVKISKKGVAELYQKTLTPVDATVKAVVSYVKNGEVLYNDAVEETFTIDMTQEGTADKYIVRCDAASAANFKNCPEDEEKITETKIKLPTEGIFGSDITWSSSVPSAISNTGKVTKQKNSKKVTLTAVISKGSAPSETYTIKNLVVPSTSGSTSGSSSGSGSSSSSNSTVSSTNNKASNVSYKGTLTPNTSLQKGDVTTATVSSFSDLGDAAWAREAVTNLFNKGVINGKTASSFAPNDDITRAEFAKIVVKAFGLEDTSANVSEFSDVKAGDWYYTAVASAYNKGIIKGYANGTFGVNDKITRQDMAVIIYRATQVANKTIAPVKDGIAFDDSADIASYASEAVSALQKGGVINGMTATTFAPKATATRAQAAQMIYGIVK